MVRRLEFVLCGAIVLCIAGPGCAFLHQTQLGEVDSKVVLEGERFEVLVSELGVDIEGAVELAKGVARFAGASKEESQAGDIIKLFQMGPRTGNPVFDDTYSDPMMKLLKARCPSGRISGLTSIRETASYPLVSGEIVKLTGYCMKENSHR